MNWWYLSMATPEKFLGACILQGSDVKDAATRAIERGMVPKTCMIVGLNLEGTEVPNEKYRDRFLTREDVLEMWPDAVSLEEHLRQGLN